MTWTRDITISKSRTRQHNKLFNGSSTQDLDDLNIQWQDMNRNYMRRISESEVKERGLEEDKVKESCWPGWNFY